MKKLYTIFAVIFMVLGLLAGCGQTEQPQSGTEGQEEPAQTESDNTSTDTAGQDQPVETETDTVSITIKDGEETLTEKEVPIEEGAVLLDVMEENFQVEATEDGFITSLEGVSQNEEEGKYWLFDINGEPSPVGAAEYELQPGDEIVFTLQATG